MAKLKTFGVWMVLIGAFLLLFLANDGGLPGMMIVALLPVLLLVGGILWFLRRQQQQGGNAWLELRKSRARRADTGQEKTRFSDVGGLVEAKAQLADVVDFLKHPERWQKAGVRLPRGVLLEGPPGSGKTLLARAVAGEAGVAVFELSASEFVEMFVGVGAARVRDSFETAAKAAPAVLFIDELDAIGRRRGSGIGGSHDEREQTLNQLLTCLDGFVPMKRLVVIAATNRADILDQALLRPGRFDVRIRLPPSGQAERVEVLRIHTRGKRLAPDVALDHLAAELDGWSGAAIESLCNEAAMRAVRRGDGPVTAADFATARQTRGAELSRYDAVDAILTESASQLARPAARAVVDVELDDGTRLRGEVVWADAAFLKLQGEQTLIIPKLRLKRILAAEGTAPVGEDALVGDPYANLRTEVG